MIKLYSNLKKKKKRKKYGIYIIDNATINIYIPKCYCTLQENINVSFHNIINNKTFSF